MRGSRTTRWGAVLAGVALVAGACGSDEDPAGPAGLGDLELIGLSRATSCDEVTDRLAAQPQWLGGGMAGDFIMQEPMAVDAVGGAISAPQSAAIADGGADGGGVGGRSDDAASSAPLAESTAESGPVPVGEFSETNVQEQGVDEPDTVKTDGSTLFVLRNGSLWVLSASDLAVLAELSQPIGTDGNADGLLLHDGHLLVTGSAWGHRPGEPAADQIISPTSGKARLVRYDVSDPTTPKEVEVTEIEGRVVTSRMVDGVARVVVAHQPQLDVRPPTPQEEADPDSWERRLDEAVAAAQPEDLLPAFETTDTGSDVSVSGTVACDAVFMPEYNTGPTTVAVHTVDLVEGYVPGEAVAVLSGGEDVYASSSTLYVATSRWAGGGVPMPVEPGAAVSPATERLIESGAVQVLEDPADDELVDPVSPEPIPTEPDVAPPMPREPEAPEVTTELHAFGLDAGGPATYLASGQVRGSVLNQFSMSEHEGVLRVATTVEAFHGRDQSESFVTTLRRDGDRLAELGQVGGLGLTERIYSVRFIGDVGYVVTFRQVDPLYTVDLSDPAAPRVRGELKIEGYSSYLHPIDDGRLVGIGQDATLEGRRTGTQMSVFDVSDLDAPSRLSKLTFGQSDSAAEHDHHAFLWWDPADLFVVPLTVHGFDQRTGEPNDDWFSGAVLVRLRGDDLVEEGRISHADQQAFAGIDRSLVIGDRLITVSDRGVAAHTLDGLSQSGFTELPGGPQPGGRGVVPVPQPLVDAPAAAPAG